MTPTHPLSAHEARNICRHVAESNRSDHTQLLVGHDNRRGGLTAVRTAGDLAKRLDAHLHIVHVANMEDVPINADSATWDQTVQQTLEIIPAK